LNGFGVIERYDKSSSTEHIIKRHEGQFVHGKLNGFGQYYDSARMTVIGEYVNDKHEGRIILGNQSGKIIGTIYNQKGFFTVKSETNETLYAGEHTNWYKEGYGESKVNDGGFFRGLVSKLTLFYLFLI